MGEKSEGLNKIRLFQKDGHLCVYIDDTKIKAMEGYRLELLNERMSKLTITILTDEILTMPKMLENLGNDKGEIMKEIKIIAEKYCELLKKVLKNMEDKPNLTAEELAKANDCVRVLGNLSVMKERGEF